MSKTVLITGGSRGIGRETAIAFSSAGYNVAITYKNSEREAFALASEINCLTLKTDVSVFAQVQDTVSKVLRHYGGIDVLINNAGIAQQKLFCDISQQDWNDMFGVNVGGIFNTCKCVLGDMINKKHGKIINISSIWGITGASCEVHYSAAKAAVIGFTKALAKEVGPSGINVNCIAPGVIDTDMNKKLCCDDIKCLVNDTPLGVLGLASDVASTILFLASDGAKFITGQVISPNGGMVI